MRTHRGIALVVVAAASLLAVPAAFAQQNPELTLEYTPSFDPEQFAASADPDQIALTDGARTAARGAYMAGLVLHLGGSPLDICVRDTASPEPGCQVEGDLVARRFRADVTFLYGFGKFDLRASLPLVLHQSTDFEPGQGMETLRSAGVGDPRIGGRYQLARPGSVGLAADLSFTIPTGGENFIGDAGLIVDPRLLADWRSGRVAIGASAGYRFRQDAAKIANLYVDDELTWSLAGEYQIEPRTISAGLALYGRVGLMTPGDDPESMGTVANELGIEEMPIEAMASARFFVTDKIALDVGAGTAVTEGYGAPPYRVLAGIQWVNRKERPLFADADGDGIADEDDDCPRKAEDVDGFEDLDGCPENDNDGDGIFDADDGCDDQPEDTDGFEDTDGCPETDNDADGLADGEDQCPDKPEDGDGFQDEDGCPDVDDDGDGIADAVDRCPKEAETVNQIDDEDGCPDGHLVAVVTSTAIVISDKVFFDLNRARVKRRSYAILDVVAQVLTTHGHLRVEVGGHTDDQGKPSWNIELSQLRAEAVVRYLVKKGIDPSRLEAKGYGYTRPLVPKKTETARSKNRRVEFVILNGGTAAPTGAGTLPPMPAAPAGSTPPAPDALAPEADAPAGEKLP